MIKEQASFNDAVPPGKAVLIVNLESGTESYAAKLRQAETARTRLVAHGWQVGDLAITRAPGHATELAANAVNRDVNVIFVAGGDGTVQEILDPLVDTETAVGMLKAGGQSLWAVEMGIPRNPIEAIDMQLAGGIAKMDIGRINGHSFRELAGLGFDGEVVHAAHGNQLPNEPRPAKSRWQYGRLANRMFEEFPGTKATITINGITYSETIDGITNSEIPLFLGWIGNTNLLSNSAAYMILQPKGRINDGLLELTVLPKVGKIEFARATIPAGIRYAVHHDGKKLPFGTYLQGSTITISTEDPVRAHVDGNPIQAEPTREFTVVTLPRALKVLKPKK